jgi:N-acetylglucosamine-6-phosphate deacetylase
MEDPMYALIGGVIFDGWSFIKNKAVVFEENKDIIDIVDDKNIDSSIKLINVDGAFITAGLVDVQINGCGGVLFNDDISTKALSIMHDACLKFGCTTFAPTLITACEEDMRKAVDAVCEFRSLRKNAVACLHFEGPFISPKKSGTHNPSIIRKLDDKAVDFLIEAAKKLPIVVTLAPEEQDMALVNKLYKNGLRLSVGHSNATYDEAVAGFTNGITMATHLFNTMPPFEGRKPGLIGAVLANDVYAGVIVDGVHSSFHSIALAKKIKGNKLYIVTDAAASMGSDLTEFEFGGFKVYVKDGICRNENGALAGSNIDMLSSLKNAAAYIDIGLEEAIKMATLYPARAVGIDSTIGSVVKGRAANLAVFDKDFNHKMTIFNGSPC